MYVHVHGKLYDIVFSFSQKLQERLLYQPSGHVIMGDLRIISNEKLWKLRPNFREHNNIDWDLCRKLCLQVN